MSADKLTVIDDPGERPTDEQRRACLAWYERAFADRLSDGTMIVLSPPRFHEDDLL